MVLCQSLGRTQNAPEAANASGVFVFSEKGAAAWVGYLIFRFACGIIYKTYYGLLRLFSTCSSWKRKSSGKYVPTDMDECEASEEYGMSQAASKRIWLTTPTMHGEEARRCPPRRHRLPITQKADPFGSQCTCSRSTTPTPSWQQRRGRMRAGISSPGVCACPVISK